MARKAQKLPKIADTASFAAVVQPAYTWAEFESENLSGVTGIPKGKATSATLLSPSGATPDARATRLHELLHAKFTPTISKAAQKLDVDAAAVQLAEDVRISHLGRKLGLFTPDTHFSAEIITGAFRSNPGPAGATFVVFASYGQPCATIDTCDVDAILGLRPSHIEPPPQWLVDAIKAGAVDLEQALAEPVARVAKGKLKGQLDDKAIVAQFSKLAHIVQGVIDVAKSPPPEPQPEHGAPSQDQQGTQDNAEQSPQDAQDGPGQPGQSDPGDGQDSDGAQATPPPAPARTRRSKEPAPSLVREVEAKFEKAAKKLAKAFEEGLEKPRDIAKVEQSDDLVDNRPMRSLETDEKLGIDATTCGQGWGRMEIATPELTRSYTGRVKRLGAPSTDGVFPAHLSRWFVDRAVLSRVGRRPGGTLLIDVSGSMNLSYAQIEKIVDAVPAINIAAYSGNTDGTGRLTILAVRGRLVAADDTWNIAHQGLNVIDGPALAWLIRQSSPRVWFCDGIVTAPNCMGLSEEGSRGAYEDALRLATLGNIRRTASIPEAVNVFLGKPSTADISVHRLAISYGAKEKAA